MSALQASVWRPLIGILAIIVLALVDIPATAHGIRGSVHANVGRGGSFGGASFGRGATVRSFGVPHTSRGSFGGASFGRSAAVRSFGVPHTSRSSIVSGSFSGNRFAVRSSANVTRAHQLFGSRVITNAAFHSAHVPFRFRGRFFGSPWPWWWGGIVIGWVGPVFWPYFYDDFCDYVFWPYAYDDFWPYAYDDIYYGIYGPYAYSVPPGSTASLDPNIASSPRQIAQAKQQGVTRQRAQTRAGAQREVCSNNGSELTEWPIQRISQVVQPTDAQRLALDELKAESAKAIDLLKSACPNDLPSIPTGRLAAMQARLESMLAAVKTVHPALDRFYQSLTDEQKVRFNAIAPGQASASANDQRDLAAFCNAGAPSVTDLPIDRIAKAVEPSELQRAALDELREASTNAAATLKADCPRYQLLTPVARTEAMEQRLAGTLGAVKMVQPVLTKFYDLLNDEQKARFNSLQVADRSQRL
jgi:hypothetical protein